MPGAVVSRLFLYNLVIYFSTFSKASSYDLPEDCLKFYVHELEEYLSKLNSKNVPTVDMMIGEFKCPVTALPFGALKSDWARLLLLQKAQPKDPVFKEKLGRLFRILVVAYFRTEERFDIIEEDSRGTGRFIESTSTLTSEARTSNEATLTTEFGTLDELTLTTGFNTTKGLGLTTILSKLEVGKSKESTLTADFTTSNESTLTTESSISIESTLSTESSISIESTLTTESSIESTLTTDFITLEVGKSKESTLTTEFTTSNESKLTTESSISIESTLTTEFTTSSESTLTTGISIANESTFTTEFPTFESSISKGPKLTTEFGTINKLTSTIESSTLEFSNSNDPKLTSKFNNLNELTLTQEFSTLNITTLNDPKSTTEFSTTNKLTLTQEFSILNISTPKEPKLTTEFSTINKLTSTTESNKLNESTLTKINSVNNSTPTLPTTTTADTMISSNHQKSITEKTTKSTFIPEVNTATTEMKQDLERKKSRGDSSILHDSLNIISSDEDTLSNFFEPVNTATSTKMSDTESTTERTRTNNIYQISKNTILPVNKVKRLPILRNPPSSNDFWKYIVISQNVTLATPTTARSDLISEPEGVNDVNGSSRKSKKRGSLNTNIEKNFRWFYNLGQEDKQVGNVPAHRRGFSIKCNRRSDGK